jgi:GNAT superfamily N-acetyltransferase
MEIRIVPYDSEFKDACRALIAALPEWFGIPEANAAYLRNLALLPSWVALAEKRVVGAAAVQKHFPVSWEVHFMAVHPAYHRCGVGKALLEKLESEARADGARLLHVKTLGPSHPDASYARTRAFYESMGFSPLFESTAFWGSANPAIVLVKAL